MRLHFIHPDIIVFATSETAEAGTLIAHLKSLFQRKIDVTIVQMFKTNDIRLTAFDALRIIERQTGKRQEDILTTTRPGASVPE